MHVYLPTGEKRESTLFPKSKFKNFTKCYYTIKIERSIDEVVGNLFSMSWASKKLLGNKAQPFENELRQKLIGITEKQKFIDRINFNMYMLTK
jgi:hypothetical protein